MSERPLSSSPYAVIGVRHDVDDDELRRAYRRALRDAHPDTGGTTARFLAVQAAWELVGTPQARSRYDAGSAGPIGAPFVASSGTTPRRDTRPAARSFGHPGGWRRERYLVEIREWVGLGDPIPDPYDARLVRSAPEPIRRLLADALVEEATARELSGLGMGFTIWHDIAIGTGDDKLDHLVLGPTGLIAVQSEDFGGPIKLVRGEIAGAAGAHAPLRALSLRAKALRRVSRARVDAIVLVVPGDELAVGVESAGAIKGVPAFVGTVERVASLLRSPIPGTKPIGGAELFEVRTRLQESISFR